MRAGQDPALFWTLTPREVETILRGAQDRQKDRFNLLAWAVWHVAKLTAYAPEKSRDFIKLEKLKWKDKPSGETAGNWQEMFARAKAWVTKG